MRKDERRKDNEDHPAAFLGGGAAGAVAGAAAGSLAGPAGAVVGAAIGGIAGAKTGESFARMPDEEETYWQENYKDRPYGKGRSYDDLATAYRSGYSASTSYRDQDKGFEDVEDEVRNSYENYGSESNDPNQSSKLEWESAREAARDSYNRNNKKRN